MLPSHLTKKEPLLVRCRLELSPQARKVNRKAEMRRVRNLRAWSYPTFTIVVVNSLKRAFTKLSNAMMKEKWKKANYNTSKTWENHSGVNWR